MHRGRAMTQCGVNPSRIPILLWSSTNQMPRFDDSHRTEKKKKKKKNDTSQLPNIHVHRSASTAQDTGRSEDAYNFRRTQSLTSLGINCPGSQELWRRRRLGKQAEPPVLPVLPCHFLFCFGCLSNSDARARHERFCRCVGK